MSLERKSAGTARRSSIVRITIGGPSREVSSKRGISAALMTPSSVMSAPPHWIINTPISRLPAFRLRFRSVSTADLPGLTAKISRLKSVFRCGRISPRLECTENCTFANRAPPCVQPHLQENGKSPAAINSDAKTGP